MLLLRTVRGDVCTGCIENDHLVLPLVGEREKDSQL